MKSFFFIFLLPLLFMSCMQFLSVPNSTTESDIINDTIIDTVITDTILDDDTTLIGYFTCDNTPKDFSVGQNHGKAYSVKATINRHGKVNRAYKFSGYSEILIPADDYNDFKEFTLSAWVQPTKIRTYNNIFTKVNPNRDFTLLLDRNGFVEVHIAHWDKYYRCRSKEPLELDEWCHITATWSDNTWKLYLNGKLENEFYHPTIEPLWTGTIMAIGSMNRSYFFTGSIDEVRFYKRALNSKEVQTLYEKE